MKKILLLLLLSVTVISCGKDGGSKPRNTATGDALVGIWINPDYPVVFSDWLSSGYDIIGSQKIRVEKSTAYPEVFYMSNLKTGDVRHIVAGFSVPNAGVLEFVLGDHAPASYKFWFTDGRLYLKFDKIVPAGGEQPDNPGQTFVYEKVEL